ANRTATDAIQISVKRISLRRSQMSPRAPAGKANRKNGNAVAVWVSATYIGPAFNDTINQAAPTLCMNVPTSEKTSAISKLRKVRERNGRHTLEAPWMGSCGCAAMTLIKVACSAKAANIKLGLGREMADDDSHDGTN